MRNISVNFRWQIKFAVSFFISILGILSVNCRTTAEEIGQISDLPRYEGIAKDLEILPVTVEERLPIVEIEIEDIAQNTPVSEEADIELTVTGEILDQPVFTPFRREGKVRDATRPIYVINREEIEAQGARTVKEALRFVPGILPDGTVGTEIGSLSGQFIRGSNTGQVLI
ncbi:MAG: TonB-dependent receptor, partial [Rivularia sp. (in: cyanobacteria)]